MHRMSPAVVITIALFLLAACARESAGEQSSSAPKSATVNQWRSAPVDPRRLPLGDRFVSHTAAGVGQVFLCRSGAPPPRPPAGAAIAGPWLDVKEGTWDLTAKLNVRGRIEWPAAEYAETVSGARRTIVTNGLPTKTVTGAFPIAQSDPAYQYDRNPNTIAAVALRVELPVDPTLAESTACLPQGPIGLLRNGVPLFAPVDELDRDAVAWETQDSCQGHPEQRGSYHYHDVSQCLRDAATTPSSVVGWAFDGHPIVIERDEGGRLPGNDDLDECHGRTSNVRFDDGVRVAYHYSVTLEFPYAVGCFRAAPIRLDR